MKTATAASSARAGFAAISIGIAMNAVKILKTLFNFMVFLPHEQSEKLRAVER
jgi:hypothetical protein